MSSSLITTTLVPLAFKLLYDTEPRYFKPFVTQKSLVNSSQFTNFATKYFFFFFPHICDNFRFVEFAGTKEWARKNFLVQRIYIAIYLIVESLARQFSVSSKRTSFEFHHDKVVVR